MFAQFPKAASYLAALPAGLASHGECRALEVHEGARRAAMARLSAAEIPDGLARLFHAPWDERWIPEVVGLTAQMIVAEQLGEAAYLRWVYGQARAIYDRPFVRHLMRLLSPSLLAMGGASRWNAMHSGSTLRVAPVRKQPGRVRADVDLAYPKALFPAIYCRALGEAFRAALDMAHARGATVELLAYGSEHARFELAWDP